jgi:transporter family-2 protein
MSSGTVENRAVPPVLPIVLLMELVLYFIAALIAGCFSPIQNAVNGVLSRSVNSPFLSGAASNFVGFLLMLAIALVVSRHEPLTLPVTTRANWWMWLGGALSAVIVTTSIIAPAKIGFASFTTILLTGQMIAALVIDATGAFGNHVIPLDAKKIIGVALLVAGVYLVKK